MATKVNPAPETGTTVEEGSGASAAASAGKVRVRWTGNTNSGIKHNRILDKYQWKSKGWDDDPIVEVDTAWWNELTPAQRKTERLEEVE